MNSLGELCRICSDDLKDKGIGIFSTECMEKLVGEKIKRYLYFSVSISDNLPKMVCPMCLTKLDNIHRFAKMAAEMQEKFRMLLAQEENIAKPKIKLRSLQEMKEEKKDDSEEPPNSGAKDASTDGVEMSFDVAVEEVGEEEDDICAGVLESSDELPGGVTVKKEKSDELDDDVDISEEEKSQSLLLSLLVNGKKNGTTDHDYPMMIKEEELDEMDDPMPVIKDEPPDPEDEDIAEEIEEDRLNQIIKDELGSDTEDEGQEVDSDVEITEMEVKVDPMLYFSNTSQTAIDVDQDSQSQDSSDAQLRIAAINSVKKAAAAAAASGNQAVMTRSQQRSNPVIASLKLGKPYKCTVCPRSFITDIGLQNHLWSHLPKKKGAPGKSATMVHKNVDLEDSQVYSSNGVLHTAQPSENIHLLKYVCPICGKKISTKGNLKVHLETHRPKGKYGCDICGRVFKTASNLYRHKDYHGGVQFPCNVCGRVYPTNSTLRAHSITHSDLRPHKCPLCNKSFKRNQDLKFHINQHTGARPYQCPYCPKAFASSGNCFSHRKRMHPMEVERDKERAAEIMG